MAHRQLNGLFGYERGLKTFNDGKWGGGDALYLIKGASFACLALLVAVYGLEENSLRKVVYLGCHGSYILWWTLHGLTQPLWYEQVFNHNMRMDSRVEVPVFVAVIGVAYLFPGWIAFASKTPMSPLLAVFVLVLFSIGMGINVSADTQKSTTKHLGKAAPEGEVWRMQFHLPGIRVQPNHLGDWMRYSAFALCSGKLVSFIVPLCVVLSNYSAMNERAAKLLKAGGKGPTNGQAGKMH